MATFRNRHGKWQARVTRKGLTPISRSFLILQDAERWARQIVSWVQFSRGASHQNYAAI